MIEDDELAPALDGALQRALAPPQVPPHLRVRLQAAMADADARIERAQRLLEREYRARQAELDARYVILRHRTLGLVVGGAFAAGAVAVAALPWLTANLGPRTPLAVGCLGALVGLAMGISFWLSSRREADLPV
jgi:hypothetical protein